MSKQKTKDQDLFSVMDFDDNAVVSETRDTKMVDCEKKEDKKTKKEIKNKTTKSENSMKQREYKKHSVEEVKEATIKYFGGDQLAADV